MALPSVTYEQYLTQGGTLSQNAFAVSLGAALSAIKDVIGLNEPQDDEDEAAYISAVCAAVDIDQSYGASGGIGESFSSLSLGSFSASSASNDIGSLYEVDMRRTIRRELLGTTLLYQGIA